MKGERVAGSSILRQLPGWVDDLEWQRIQATIPVACVDVLPTSTDTMPDAGASAVGLILRETPAWGRKWCLIGGRVLRNESLPHAVARQLFDALGDDIQFDLDAGAQPTYVAQYFTEPKKGGGLDPRQHAIGLIFAVPIGGRVEAQGEAIEFAWFGRYNLPHRDEFGFGQHDIVKACLARLDQ